MHEDRRRDKLDDALLFLIGSVGIVFGLIQVFVISSTLLQFIIPVALLGWVLPFYFGYVRGAIGDSIADRYRGWLFLVVGMTLYSVILAEQQISRFITNPDLEWIVPVSSTPLLGLFVYRLGHLRRFVLGPRFPVNEVLSRSAFNAVVAAAVLSLFGALFAAAKFETVESYEVGVVLAIIAAVPFTVLIRRSNYYALRVDWPYSKVKKSGRFHGHRTIELVKRILRIIMYASGITAAGAIVLLRLGWYNPSSLFSIASSLLGLVVLLLLPVSILNFLTRTNEIFVFNETRSKEHSTSNSSG